MANKRAVAPGVNISVLILLIAFLIVAYVILLPPSEREKLLDGENVSTGKGAEGVLLSEIPGLVSPVGKGEVKHKVANIELFLRSKPEVDELADSLTVERNLFQNNFQILSFNIEDIANLERAVLFFSVKEPKGKLVIDLNGHEIYSAVVKKSMVESVTLPALYLKDQNELKIYSELSVFSFNSFILGDIKLRQEYKVENVKEDRIFTISEGEFSDLDRMTLKYFTYCNIPSDGRLKIFANNNLAFYGVVSCYEPENEIEIDLGDLLVGKNTLTFEIDKGDYSFSSIEIVGGLEDGNFKVYNFVVPARMVDEIERGRLNAVLSLELTGTEQKEADIFINGDNIVLATGEKRYMADISNYLIEGTNSIEVIPENTFTISKLEIKLE